MQLVFLEHKTQNFFRRIRHKLRIPQSTLIKVFSLTAVSTLIKLLTAFITIKVVAITIGATGIALLGQLNNATSILMAFASAGITNGVIKFTSEYKENPNVLAQFLSTAFRITTGVSVLCGLGLIIFSEQLAFLILLQKSYAYIFIIFGCTILLYALNTLFIAVLNGFKEYKKFVWVSIATSIVGLLFSVNLIWWLGLKGALISAVTNQSIVLLLTLWIIRKAGWFTKYNFLQSFKFEFAKKYFGFTIMAITTALSGPLTQLFIRGKAIHLLSAERAGWWEAMNRLSGMYLLIVTTSFTVYYLPRLSELNDRAELKKEIYNACKFIIPIIAIGFVVIYVMRYWVIAILFSKDFYPMASLFSWQLAGDLFKISSFLFAFLMIAKSKTTLFVLTEVSFALLLLLLSVYFIQYNGIVGLTQGYALTYLIYLITMFGWSRKYLSKNSVQA